MKIFRTPDEFIDTISSMSGRKFVTFGYICGANLNLPQTKRVNPKTGRMVKCNDLPAFANELGVEGEIGGMVKLSRYNLRFMSRNEFTKAYGEFNKKFGELKTKYDYPEANRKSDGKYTETMDYGKGIDVYKGNREELKGKTYIKQDITGAKVRSKYYLLDKDGFIINEYSKQDLTEYLKDMRLPEPGVIAMRKLGRDEAEIQAYIKEFTQIKLIPKSFEYNQILYMVGTADGEKFLYINDQLQNTIRDVECEIDVNQFVKIAENQYKDSFIELSQYVNEVPQQVNEAVNIFNKAISKNMININMNKKKLYEHIMNNVAVEVKRAINENDFYDDEIDDIRQVSPTDLNTSAYDLYKQLGPDGQYMIDCYEDAYEYFFQDFALYCKYNNKNVLKDFINYKKNYID